MNLKLARHIEELNAALDETKRKAMIVFDESSSAENEEIAEAASGIYKAARDQIKLLYLAACAENKR